VVGTQAVADAGFAGVFLILLTGLGFIALPASWLLFVHLTRTRLGVTLRRAWALTALVLGVGGAGWLLPSALSIPTHPEPYTALHFAINTALYPLVAGSVGPGFRARSRGAAVGVTIVLIAGWSPLSAALVHRAATAERADLGEPSPSMYRLISVPGLVPESYGYDAQDNAMEIGYDIPGGGDFNDEVALVLAVYPATGPTPCIAGQQVPGYGSGPVTGCAPATHGRWELRDAYGHTALVERDGDLYVSIAVSAEAQEVAPAELGGLFTTLRTADDNELLALTYLT
jgi:hypothetical protein